MKKLIALALALFMLGGIAMADALPGYLKQDASELPLVNEGTDITLRVVAYNDWYRGDEAPEDHLYGWKWMEKHFGVKFEVTLLDSTNRDERRNLLFAEDNLPDIMIGLGLNTSDIINYGTVNEQLLNLKPMLDAGIAPDISAIFESDVSCLKSSTTPEGAIFGAPWYWGEEKPSALNNMCNWRVFINDKWLEAVGMESPSTAEELLAVLRAFKEQDPNGVGADKIVPMNLDRDFEWMLEDAFLSGYGISGATTRYAATLTGSDEVVAPIMTEGYRDFIEFLRICYSEGLISPDYFTLTDEQMRAINAEGRSGVLADWAHYLSIEETWGDWSCLKPLQVDGITTTVAHGASFSVNQGLIASASEYPELALRVMNAFYQVEPFTMIYAGPSASMTDDLFGLDGLVWNPEKEVWDCSDIARLGYTSSYEFVTHEVYPFNQNLGCVQPDGGKWRASLEGIETPEKDVWANAQTDADLNYRWTCYNTTHEFLSESYPTVYLNEEEATEATDLSSTLNDYTKAETAKFITGDRAMADWDAFLEELRALGIDRYIEIYDGVYHTK